MTVVPHQSISKQLSKIMKTGDYHKIDIGLDNPIFVYITGVKKTLFGNKIFWRQNAECLACKGNNYEWRFKKMLVN